MRDYRHITWENFKSNYIGPRDPAQHQVPGNPETHLFVEAGARRLGMRIAHESTEALPERPLSQIHVAYRRSGDQCFLEVSTEEPDIYEPFYAVMVAVADHVQLQGLPPIEAINRSIDRFGRLLTQRTLLSDEKLIGLWGELWFLIRLLGDKGSGALSQWTGPRAQAHDFRLETCDIEVKTAAGEERTHMVSAINQLEPSPNRAIYLLSLQIAQAGDNGGATVPSMVNEVRGHLRQSPEVARSFESLLAAIGFDDSVSSYYRTAYIKRAEARLVPIDDGFPRITQDMLSDILNPQSAARIGDVRYRVNVSGLGYPERASEFTRTLG